MVSKKTPSHRYAVIMAGGGGTRLWPMSRGEKPKQFHSILGERSLLQRMYRLLLEDFDSRHIYVQIPEQFRALVAEQLPKLPPDQILIEPQQRDTGPAFAFAALSVLARDPQATVGFYYSDHFIQSEKAFSKAVHGAFSAAEAAPDHIVLVGVRPLYPHTGLGYIEMGKPARVGTARVHAVQSFVEKPDTRRAKRFIASKKFLWNTGYKVGSAAHFVKLMSNSNAAYNDNLPPLQKALSSGSQKEVVAVYEKLPRQSFEYSITEKARGLLVVASDMLWSDVGDWGAIDEALLGSRGKGARTVGNVVDHGSKNSLIVSNFRPVVTVGLEGIVVVESEHGVLVMSKEKSSEMKQAIEKLRARHPESL